MAHSGHPHRRPGSPLAFPARPVPAPFTWRLRSVPSGSQHCGRPVLAGHRSTRSRPDLEEPVTSIPTHDPALAEVDVRPRRIELRRLAPQAWVRPKFYEALASQMENLPEGAAEIAGLHGLEDLPLVVLTATNPSPRRLRQQEEATRLSSTGVHRIARNSGHWIPVDEPELVIESVLEVVRQARSPRTQATAE